MTLEELAGTELTKGMLSLIENNKAQPSIESLNYIAKRLGVEVGELLEEVSTQELRDLLEKVEKIYTSIVKIEESEKYFTQVIDLVTPYIDKLSKNYESARLLDLYGRCLYNLKKDGWQPFIERAADIYVEMKLSARRADIARFYSGVEMNNRNYEKSLEILIKERKQIESAYPFIDPTTRLNFDYFEAVLLLAVGHVDRAITVLENGIEYSKQHKIFYRINDLYRLYGAYALLYQDEEKLQYYAQKLKLYGEFADDKDSVYLYYILQAELLMFRDEDYEGAYRVVQPLIQDIEDLDEVSPYNLLTAGKALYGLKRFEEALTILEKAHEHVPDYLHHPYDLALVYSIDIYRALCYLEFANFEKAMECARTAVKNIDSIPETPLNAFIHEKFEEIKDGIIKAAIDK